jgi:RNA polymerase sigma factor (sigma-70 family)
MKTESPDAQLIALIDRVAVADEAALRQLYDLTSSKLYGVAVRVVTNREWAEDVLQEAYLNIWRIAADYKASLSPPMAWMALVVRSRGLDFLRRRTSDRADHVQELDETISETVAGNTSRRARCTTACNNLKTNSARSSAWLICATLAMGSLPSN